MNSLTLKILLTSNIFYALLKFLEFFFRSGEAKMKGLEAVYVRGGGAGSLVATISTRSRPVALDP